MMVNYNSIDFPKVGVHKVDRTMAIAIDLPTLDRFKANSIELTPKIDRVPMTDDRK